MKRINRTQIFAILTLYLSAASACTSSPAKPQDKVAPATASQPSLDIFVLSKGKLSTSIQIPGELIAFQQVDLYAKVNSFVQKLYVDIGSQVRTGQLLAVLDAPELSAQLAEAESRLKSQQAIFLASRANYERLFETSQTPGTVSQNDIDQALSKKNSDSAQLEAAGSAYRVIAETRNYLEIRAPFAGVISSRNVNLGAYVGPSGKGSEMPLFTLQEQSKLRLAISVPESYTGYFHAGMQVGFRVPSLPNRSFSAVVRRLAGALDERLRSERIEMDINNSKKDLLPGMVAEVEIPLPASDSSFVIPSSAFVNSTERTFVIRVSDHKAQWIDVKKGRESEGKMEIFGDLHAGDLLVKSANEEIRDGSPISDAR